MMRRLRGGFWREDGGLVTVEFVAMLPLFLGILVLVFELGRGLWYHQIVTKGVRDGARYVSRVPLTEEFEAFAKNVALTGQPTGGTAHQFWTDPNTVTITPTLADPDGTSFRVPVTVVEVRAEVPVLLGMMALLNVDTGWTLVASDRVRHIGE